MKNSCLFSILILGLVVMQMVPTLAADPIPSRTFCNPLNLDYGPYARGGRHGADPVIVLFKDRYYLFDTWDKLGYRMSDDLIHWTVIPFDAATLPLAADMKPGEITAPAVVADSQYVYFVNFGSHHVLRTADPASGKWEEGATMHGGYGDPDLFFDDDGKVYMLSGLGEADIVELDPKTFDEIKGTKTQLTTHYKTAADFDAANSPYGLFTGHDTYNHVDWNKPGALDTTPIIGKSKQAPTQEGTWLTKYNGRYYMQDSSPDTSCPWYSDVVYESDKILGPYTLCDYAPASMKVGGFINSTGHSCVFQDRYGNYWRVTTMWVGAFTGFERRIGLFPVGFDAKGRMFTQTTLGDYPMIVPQGKYDPNTQSPLAGWFVLSTGKTCTASSTYKQFTSSLASDENVRTWWSAETGNKGEWFQMDLGKPCVIDAAQVNFAEQDCLNAPLADDYTQYQLLVSSDGIDWRTVADKSASTTALPHDYVPFAQPLTARFLKVVNIHTAKDGKFALRDLRVFGNGGGTPPPQVSGLKVERLTDPRNVTFTWNPAPGADGYVIHYGVAPDALHLNLQYQGGEMAKLTVSCLNRNVKYYYRIDSYNDSGVAQGEVTKVAQ
jgi:xylan 1,4-beta-xylosidase